MKRKRETGDSMIIFEPSEQSIAKDTVRFTAKDGTSTIGFCDLSLQNGFADIVAVQLQTNDLSIGEGLLRAAFHFAANRGYYMGRFLTADCNSVRSLLPFELKDGVWCNDIPTLLSGTCGKN